MRCVGVCSACLSPSGATVQRRSSPLHFGRTDLSKISRASSRALRAADKFRSSSCGSRLVGAGARASLILSVFALTVLTTACANATPEVGSWHFTAVFFDRPDPPPAHHGEKPSSGWRTIVFGPVTTRQGTSAAGWRTEVIPYETEWPVISAGD